MLKRNPGKACRWCGDPNPNHWPYQCFKNPKQPKLLKAKGKYGKQWDMDKATWYRNNPPIQFPYPHYICYLPGHGEWLRPPGKLAGLDNPLTEITTLDHVKSRSKHPGFRSSQWNFKPCCYNGNQEKGSKDGDL